MRQTRWLAVAILAAVALTAIGAQAATVTALQSEVMLPEPAEGGWPGTSIYLALWSAPGGPNATLMIACWPSYGWYCQGWAVGGGMWRQTRVLWLPDVEEGQPVGARISAAAGGSGTVFSFSVNGESPGTLTVGGNPASIGWAQIACGGVVTQWMSTTITTSTGSVSFPWDDPAELLQWRWYGQPWLEQSCLWLPGSGNWGG